MEEPKEHSRSAGCCDWQKTIDDLAARTQEFVRKEPSKALGAAAIAGALLTVLPVGRVLAALVRLALALLRPLVLVLGLVKLCEEFQKTQRR